MTLTKSFARLAAATAVATVTAFGAQASASGSPLFAYFYSGPGQTGTRAEIDLDETGVCHNFAEPARSYDIASTNDIEVYWNRDCRPSEPGYPDFRTGTLSTGELPLPGMSYRVRLGWD
ncbi:MULTISPECIES: hypothetical protein [Streptomyces]|uniref:Uncharacterized protein n=1 Tax=Streptomyces canarius TaxID=285453 RepID=A0ABQ3D6C5_9ACTN|nr:hypothetical protein [Streptomyces canarius]GHA55068.1 hypothetical protein GCM10010345_69530 [Streptomyces canarius]